MKKYIFLFISILVFTACTDGFEEMNIDPNNPVTASSSSILLGAQRSMSRTLLDDNNIFTMLNWVQYSGSLGYRDQTYNFDWNTDQTYNNVALTLNNFELLRKQAIEDKHENYEAIAMIMKAWVFGNFTDMNGDIPYSEALKGTEGVLYPKFDSQESIYRDIILKLEEAHAKINDDQNAAKVDSGSDLFCQGDMLKWKKFANSLRARIYLRMSEVDETTAKAGLEEIFQNPDMYPVLMENADNVGVKFIGETSSANTNVFVQQASTGTLRSVSSTVVEMLCANNDPRRTILLNATQQSIDSVNAGKWSEYEYVGAPPAVKSAFNSFEIKKVSTVGDDIALAYHRPVDVITYAEVKFIQAEAALKGYDVNGTAENLYNEGVVASMKKWGVNDQSSIDQYLLEPFVVFDINKGIEQIINQRYIDQFHGALNTFAMIRRSGYPKLKYVSIGFANENGYPDRMPYAFNMRGNPNYRDVESQVIKNLWGKMWFAKETTVNLEPVYQEPIMYKFSDN
ncbi:SusD/RagB family nutrient-binding outer membrane lipoprotein [Aureibaculum sp. A20]|uniref:SusD/RagB family nutrient-binding outer membrane lipoprotein n=1 Tax=Aureibaculum flavum TaxID=2795986 RepID=A0ABS0WVV7_9FLAO|nr:SusD/RagB family nutrient-binding outer membrane lipoprotein [Aureibaculum flavum]MBJ2176050.1 SusD/RagB family nutrient-binding outer membrane lipoprotein [Aureibaculum flavum]